MSANIPQYLIAAQFAQLQYAEKEANQLVFKGSFPTPRYSLILSVTRQAIQARYNKLPNDPTLQATGEFMYALSGGVNTTPKTVSTAFIIVTQPLSQTVNSGSNVSFLVLVTGGVNPDSYQWSFNGTPIGGATNPTYSITGATSPNAGSYTVQIKDSSGQILNSIPAILTVNAPALVGSYYYGNTDYFADLNSGNDDVPYIGTFPITNGQPLVILFPLAAANNQFIVIRYPNSQSVKTAWQNTITDQGPIPDNTFRTIITIGSNLYIVSRVAMSLDSTNTTLTFS